MSRRDNTESTRIGLENRRAVERYFMAHPDHTQIQCAKALGISGMAVSKHVRRLREEATNGRR